MRTVSFKDEEVRMIEKGLMKQISSASNVVVGGEDDQKVVIPVTIVAKPFKVSDKIRNMKRLGSE